MNYEELIGDNIRKVRKIKNMSQQQLAKKCGVTNTVISAYENKKKIPSLVTIGGIAQALGVGIDRLYFGDENASFIISAPDEGRKIVNALYLLWSVGMLHFYEDSLSQSTTIMDDMRNHIHVGITKHMCPVKRLINGLVDFGKQKDTYPDPNAFLEMLLSSVAMEINKEIEKENLAEQQSKNRAGK